MGADRVARVGAVRNGRPGAMRASGKRRNAPGAPRRPTREGRALLAASRVAHCLWCRHHGAARALLAAKSTSVKCVIIYDLWYKPCGRVAYALQRILREEVEFLLGVGGCSHRHLVITQAGRSASRSDPFDLRFLPLIFHHLGPLKILLQQPQPTTDIRQEPIRLCTVPR